MSLHLITGGAGFIAVTLIRRLLERGDAVIAIDDLSRGLRAHWEAFDALPDFAAQVADCAVLAPYQAAVVAAAQGRQIDHVWHLAANSDIPAGIADPSIDLNGTFLTTFNTLLVMRALNIPALHFASSSAIYGDLGDVAIHEDIGPLEPISNYGAMKLASEAQIRAAVEAFLGRADIFRFPNVVGVPATHGVMLDFVRKLKSTPDTLDVLGNGTQMKAYLHVEELVDAMLFVVDTVPGRYTVLNVGPPDAGITVRAIAEIVRDLAAPGADIRYGEGGRGWVGDVPKFRYSTERLTALGWKPKLDSAAAVRRAAEQIVAQEGAG